MDGPAGRPADNLPNSDGLGVSHQTVPKLMVQDYWQPGQQIGQWLSLDPDPDQKWWSGTATNTTRTPVPALDPAGFTLIKYSSSNRIMIWSVCRLFSFSCWFTLGCQFCDPTDICWVAWKSGQILTKISGFSITTQQILVGSPIWKWEVKKRLDLDNGRTDHVMIQSVLQYLIGTKDLMLKCRVFGVESGPIAIVRVFV